MKAETDEGLNLDILSDIDALLNRKKILSNILNFKYYIIQFIKSRVTLCKLTNWWPFQWLLRHLFNYDITKYGISLNFCYTNTRWYRSRAIVLNFSCIVCKSTTPINTEIMQSCNAHIAGFERIQSNVRYYICVNWNDVCSLHDIHSTSLKS